MTYTVKSSKRTGLVGYPGPGADRHAVFTFVKDEVSVQTVRDNTKMFLSEA